MPCRILWSSILYWFSVARGQPFQYMSERMELILKVKEIEGNANEVTERDSIKSLTS